MVLAENIASQKGTGRYRKEYQKRYRKVSDSVKTYASRKGTGRYREFSGRFSRKLFVQFQVFLPKSMCLEN